MMKLKKIKLDNDSLCDSLSSNCADSLQEYVIAKITQEISLKRENIIKEKLKEVANVEINFEEEQKRRFKRLFIEYKESEEVIYFNDGSVEGLRVVTFVSKHVPPCFDDKDFKMGIEYSYY